MPPQKKAKKAKKKQIKKAKKTKRTVKKTRGRKGGRAPAPKKQAVRSVSVGDLVRIPPDAYTAIRGYASPGGGEARSAEAIVGVVCSVRNISTGNLVTQTRGDLTGFVLELIHSQTFRPHYGSDRNTGGPRGPEDIRQNPVLNHLRRTLHDLARKGNKINTAGVGFTQEPLKSVLDGWRVVKVKAEVVESAE
ncbi:MAG: hypothetical protein JXA57_13025 [Armatimonadetes bacterium]|nr:hypothetical protein [Armatimonadota bacterium]